MDRPIVALVLAGGTGTRLYPASRSDRPKQFRSFGGDRSLLTSAIERVGFADETYVLTREAFADEVHDHAPEAAVLTEPAPKDTGPALVYAAHRIREQVGDCVLLAVPSDHVVGDGFEGVGRRAARTAVETEGLVTVGVEPTRPEPGYGYIEPGESREGYETVTQFREKPDRETATEYVDRGCYWNAGMFAWTPEALLSAARASPLSGLVDALERGEPERGFDAVDPVSVDYAVLERAEEVLVVPANFAWDDLGAWDALARHLPTEDDGNAVLGDAVTVDAADNVVATDGHVSLVGVSDLVVASYGDRTLVVPADESQRVREVVARLRDEDAF
ncbi:mannose-1-phosphate guanylyltransferase [Halomicrobium sp. IBSBa]|uniref:mannose-1-phosphate guanylyltransferase n=1 Tax=Halomicrobium sp. IBSBa TaxID=2778916 RepID=UPI001ABF0D4B|nr:sugar phosphate nucleotidyltransferase [Halomicrobium sp. IBSBa]MBO4247841.1 mannose-1-phosphate guanylyltransferase [Halomicrobium sp. IBSBa]